MSYQRAKAQYEAKQEPSGPSLQMCGAHGCRFAGSMAGDSHASSWWCAHHYGAHSSDLGRITAVLDEHAGLVEAVIDVRQRLADAKWTGASAMEYLGTLQAHIEGLGYQPSPLPQGAIETYPGYAYRLELLLGRLVGEAVKRNSRPAASQGRTGARASLARMTDQMRMASHDD